MSLNYLTHQHAQQVTTATITMTKTKEMHTSEIRTETQKADWWEKRHHGSAAKQNLHMQIRSQACHATNKPRQIRPNPGDIRMI